MHGCRCMAHFCWKSQTIQTTSTTSLPPMPPLSPLFHFPLHEKKEPYQTLSPCTRQHTSPTALATIPPLPSLATHYHLISPVSIISTSGSALCRSSLRFIRLTSPYLPSAQQHLNPHHSLTLQIHTHAVLAGNKLRLTPPMPPFRA